MGEYKKQEIFDKDGGILKAEHLRYIENAIVEVNNEMTSLDERLGYVENASDIHPEILSGLYKKYDKSLLLEKKAYTNVIIGNPINSYVSSGMGNSASNAIPVKSGSLIKINGKTVGSTQLIAITDEQKICYEKIGSGVLVDTLLSYTAKYDGFLFVTAVADDNFYLEIISPNVLYNIKTQHGGIYTTPCTPRCPYPQLPGDNSEGADFDVENVKSSEIDDYMDELVMSYSDYITKEELGLDSSGEYKVNRYILGKLPYLAWVKPNCPNMYVFENNKTVIYFKSISPRIGDTYYTTATIDSPSTSVVSEVKATNQSVIIDGVEYISNPLKNVRATCVYTKEMDYGTNNYCYNSNNQSLYRVSE